MSLSGFASLFGPDTPRDFLLTPTESLNDDVVEILEEMDKYAKASREFMIFEASRTAQLDELIRKRDEIGAMSNKLKTKLLKQRSMADAQERTREVAIKAASVAGRRTRIWRFNQILVISFLIYLLFFW